jgi:hypothetical protein
MVLQLEPRPRWNHSKSGGKMIIAIAAIAAYLIGHQIGYMKAESKILSAWRKYEGMDR